MYAMRHVDDSSWIYVYGIEAILTAMKEYKSNEEIQECGCEVLSSLAAYGGRLRKEFV